MSVDRVGAGITTRTIALVAAGGAVGGPARYAVESLLPAPAGGLPWGTLAVNVAGALALGMLVGGGGGGGGGRARPGVAAAVGTGFLGAFTTFSGWVLQVLLLAQAGRPAVAAAYLTATLATGLAAAAVGVVLGRRRSARKRT